MGYCLQDSCRAARIVSPAIRESRLTRKTPVETCNALCARCIHVCRQPAGTVLVCCPRFQPRPFKIKEYRFDQLDLFDPRKP